MKQDFEFIKRITSDFFSQESVKDTLRHIKEWEIYGWENWVQVEFAKFCNHHPEISNSGREIRYELDKRVSKDKFICSIDLFIRQKHKHSSMGVEFKQKRLASACIRAMFDDYEKIRKIKYSQYDLRSVWFVGIHPKDPHKNIDTLITRNMERTGIDIDTNFIFSQEIDGTGFSVTII